nr:Protein C32F10.4 [Haemonchus contortus]
MYDEEPRAFCNMPLSGTVGILSSLVLLSQVIALFLVCSNNFFIYFFELLIAFGMVFFLSQGVRQQKPGHLTIYIAYLAIYVFMMLFIIFGILMSSSPASPLETNRIENPSSQSDSDEDDDPNCVPLNGAFWASVWVSVGLSILSVLIACIQIRYTLVLYRFLRTRQRQLRSTMNVSYQHFVPGAPPRYTPESPHTIQTSPAQVEAGPLPPKLSQPEVATLHAESLMPPPANPPPSPMEKPILPAPFLRVEGPPEYTERPGPSEITYVTPTRPHENMEEVDLNEVRSPSRVNLLH